MALPSYRIFIRFEVQATLETLSESTRDRVLVTIERLGRDPFAEPDGMLVDDQDRSYDARYVDDCAVLYRVDHAEKEIRVVDVLMAAIGPRRLPEA